MQELFSSHKTGVVIQSHEEAEYLCLPGTPLVGTVTSRGFYNAAFYEVQKVSKEAVVVRDTLTGSDQEVTPELLGRSTAIAWAVVFHKAQGLTIRDKVVALHDLGHPYITRAHIYVGASRVTNGADLRVAQ